MISSLFKPGWQSDSIDKRLQSVAEMDIHTADNQAIFEKLASDDEATDVRHAAMAKIANPQTLYDLWQSHAEINSRQAAEIAFGVLIHSACNFSEAEFRTFLQNNPSAELAIAKFCPHAAIRKELLFNLAEPEQAELIADVAYSETRSQLADNISDLSCLEIARKKLRGKDKNAEKIVKAKIDALHAEQKLDHDNAALAKTLREKMQILAAHEDWRDETKNQFQSYSKRWEELGFEPSEEEKLLYHQAYKMVAAEVTHNLALQTSQQNQDKIVSTLEVKCIEIATDSLEQLLNKSTTLAEQLRDLSQQWSKESAISAHTLANSERFIRATKSIESALTICQRIFQAREIQSGDGQNNISKSAKAIIAAAKSPDWADSQPPLESASEAILEAEQLIGDSKKVIQDAKDKLDKLHLKINRILGTTQRGDLARARRELSAAVKATNKYVGEDRKRLDERLAKATDAVKKMGDWKDFATEPKLIELCDEMERLAKIDKPNADKQATKINKLQQDWKALGSSDIADTLWPRFKEAADKAYEPCASFFKQRRATQRDNLKKRDPLVGQMKDLFEATDWENQPDYKLVEENLRQIMQAWQNIKDVEQGPGQKQWLKLCKIKDVIYEKLDQEYDKNIGFKNSLIEQLEQMLGQQISEQSLAKLQLIQSKWKQAGITRRKQDQAAWKKFKFTSDAVYGKIQGLRNEKRAGEDAQIANYTEICKQIQQLAKSAIELSISDKEFESLEQAYTDLPALPHGLPEKLIDRLNKDYDRACSAYAKARVRINQAKRDQEIELLWEKARLCSELEQLPTDVNSETLEQLKDKINSLDLANKATAKRFHQRLSKARETNREEFGKARQLLLIETEILLGIDSPQEDRALRMQIQLDKMKSQGIGNTPTDKTKAIKELNLNWLCLPGADVELQNKLDKRFAAITNKSK